MFGWALVGLHTFTIMLTFYKLILRESSKRGRPDTLTGTSPMESSKRVSKEQVILQNIAYLLGLEGSV